VTDPFVVEIEVLDSVGRRRMLAVRGGDAGVVLVPPPGGGFTVPPSHVEQLRKALADARAHTLRAGWGDQ
jgi:NAD(P)H-dependent flavin oxidoreductase YrpB (nitropropane dioxygenase family)